MNSGFFAFLSSFAASSTKKGSGATRREGKPPERRIGPDIGALDRPVLHVERQRDVRRAGTAGGHRLEGLAEDARDVGRAVEHRVPLGQRLHQGPLIELRQREFASRRNRYVGVDREDRNGGFVRLDQARQDVGRAAARRAFAHADLAADARIAVGHVRGMALVARQDVLDRAEGGQARRRAAGWCRRTGRRSPRRRARLSISTTASAPVRVAATSTGLFTPVILARHELPPSARQPPPGELFLDHVAHFVPDLGAAARAARRSSASRRRRIRRTARRARPPAPRTAA